MDIGYRDHDYVRPALGKAKTAPSRIPRAAMGKGPRVGVPCGQRPETCPGAPRRRPPPRLWSPGSALGGEGVSLGSDPVRRLGEVLALPTF